MLSSELRRPLATLGDVVKEAHRRLPPNDWDYLTGGAETETTLRRNRMAFDSLAFRPRVLRDVSQVDASVNIMGHDLRIPVIMAPIGSLAQMHADGALAVARAAEAFGGMSFLSSAAAKVYGLENVRKASSSPMIYQLYVRGDDDWVVASLQEAIDMGYGGFCLTVDSATIGRRERNIANDYKTAEHKILEGREYGEAISWDLLKRLRDTFDGTIAVKGVVTSEDAALAVEHGVDMVYVSNHGGRQFDHGRGAIETLPEVVEAVGSKATVIFDSGIARGSDVLKAIALGADAVCIGKLQGWGLAAGGEAGLIRVLEILELEITTNMKLLGVTSMDQLDPAYVHEAAPTNPPSVLSAYPLIDIPERRY